MTTSIQPTRRTLVRSAAWTVPVIAVASTAPAFAASPCDTQGYTLDWGNNAKTTYSAPNNPGGTGTKTSVATVLPPTGSGASALGVTFTSTMFGSMSRANDNLLLSTETNVGGLGQGQGLNMSHAAAIPTGYANRQEVTVSFARAVTNLQFSITDVDAQQNGWIDQVAVTGTRTGVPAAGTVQGSGTNESPWMPVYYGNAGNNQGTGNVALTFPSVAANTPFTIAFWNLGGNSNQRIFLGNMTFSAKGC